MTRKNENMKSERFSTLTDAKEAFQDAFMELTANEWRDRDRFAPAKGFFKLSP